MYIALHAKYPLLFSDSNENLNFLDRFSKYNQTSKFYDNPSSGSRVVPCGQTQRHDESNSRFSQNLSKRPNTGNIPKPTAVHTLRRQVSQTPDLNLTSVHLPTHKYFKPFYRDADKSLALTRKETSSEACQGRARFQQHRDASCHQGFFFPARQGAEGNSRHSDRNISLFLSWSD